jgi:ATP-dependent DNA helicase RecG
VTPEKFWQIISEGEKSDVEFKESFDREAVETAGAFANSDGGVILIGVTGKGRVSGVNLGKSTLNDWANQISSATDPRLTPDIEILAADGKTVVAVDIKQFPARPVAVRGRCYRRVGSSNRMMTASEIAEMHLVVTGSSWDAFPVRDVTMRDIDLEKVKHYITAANATGRRHINPADPPLKVLRKLRLLSDDHPTLAAVVLFSKTDEWTTLPPPAHCGRLKEKVVVVDDRMIRGTLVEQVEGIMEFIRKNTNVRFVMTGRPARQEIWDYPLDALREAVVNAVCHRDYRDHNDIQVRIYDDELTIWNPGKLLPGMTIEELLNPTHSSVLRNQLIGQVLYDIELIERYGGGIHKILDACEMAGIPAPTFEERAGGFQVTFRKDIYDEEHLRALGLNERQIGAVKHVREHGRITNRGYRELHHVSANTALRDLTNLCRKGILQCDGASRRDRQYSTSRQNHATSRHDHPTNTPEKP